MSFPLCGGQRGPVGHERREQIVGAAREHFRHYGYEKTTVADLASAIGLSKAYIYKFFESKQAIGEAVCSGCLSAIACRARSIAIELAPAAERLRRIIRELARKSADLFFQDRKIHDLATTSARENWEAGKNYNAAILAIVRSVLSDGRKSGEFERKTPLDETSRAVMQTLQPFLHPLLLQDRLENLEEDADLIASLVLRSLAP